MCDKFYGIRFNMAAYTYPNSLFKNILNIKYFLNKNYF